MDGEKAIVSLGAGLLLGGLFVGLLVNSGWRDDATKRHYGGYCQDTGKWNWNGECERQP